ncbi:hypothetical protein MYX75_07475 [Acidobacteria bacterium AH-259-A15]|nr:hypothetical protein [Acidobacteria bacterium AH-259-A15]
MLFVSVSERRLTGLDTNVLDRYLVKDEPRQTRTAVRFMRETAERGDLLFLNQIVLCELVWELESAYGYAREDIAVRPVQTSRISLSEIGPDETENGLLSRQISFVAFRTPTNDLRDAARGRPLRGF